MGIHFIGSGDFGNTVTIKLSKIYQGMGNDLFGVESDNHQNHLHIHSYPSTETDFYDEKDHTIILLGSIDDPYWKEARKTFHERRPYFILTFGIRSELGIDTIPFHPFPEECLVFPDPSLFDSIELAKLVLQFFFIHTPWNVSRWGSLIGYDLSDTKQIFAGKVTKVLKMTSNKERYRQDFSKFLTDNKVNLSRSRGILVSFWGRDDVLDLPTVHELWGEIQQLTIEEAQLGFTYHVLAENGPDFMTTLFYCEVWPPKMIRQ